MKKKLILKNLSLAILGLATCQASAQYSFVKVADTATAVSGGTIGSFIGMPAISGSTAAFTANYNGTNRGVFTGGGGGVLTTIVTNGASAPVGTFNNFSPPSISGTTVAFSGNYGTTPTTPQSSGIFVGSGGALTTLTKSGDPAPIGTFLGLGGTPAISGSTVAFAAGYGVTMPPTNQGIFTGSGATLTTIVKTGDPAPVGTFNNVGPVSISGSTVAFGGRYGATMPPSQGIFTSTGGALTTIVKTGDPAPVGTFANPTTGLVSISGGTVAFIGTYGVPSTNQGVFAGTGGALTTIVKTGDPAPVGTFSTFQGASLSGGTVAFVGRYNNGARDGLFTGNGGALSTVIREGDPLFASTVTSLSISSFGLDAGGSGTITFSYVMANGRSGVAIAIPSSGNTIPTVSCPAPVVVPCTSAAGANATVTVALSDANNDPLTVTWTVDNVLVATHTTAAGATSDGLVNHPFGFGPHIVAVSVTDGKSSPVTCETTVAVTAHDAPVPSLASLPPVEDQCSASISEPPTAIDICAEGGIVTGTTTDLLSYTAQGTYTVTWTYTSEHDPSLFTTQPQTVIVRDTTAPTIICPSNATVAYGSVPTAATTVAELSTQGGTIEDNCDPNGDVTSYDITNGVCPTVITRSYFVSDAAGNGAGCEQTITVNNLFAEDGIVWHQPLARSGMSEDTDPSAGNTLKYRFKVGSTIPIQVHAVGCSADVTANANVIGRVVVFGDTDMDGVIDANEGALLIDYNGVGEAGGVMDKIGGHLKYNLDTKKLPQTFKCYILQAMVTDSSTGESQSETVPLQAK